MEIVNQISIFIGIWVAIYGIDAWRREHKGKRQIELAEETLALFYESADAIKHMRNPMSYGSESESLERFENEPDHKYEARQRAQVLFKRYNDHQELFNKLYASRYRFMAQVGKQEAKPFDDLRSILNELLASAKVLASLWARQQYRNEAQRENQDKQIERMEAIFWEGIEEDDPIKPKIDKVIEEVESTCNNIISGAGTLYGFLNFNLAKKG